MKKKYALPWQTKHVILLGASTSSLDKKIALPWLTKQVCLGGALHLMGL